MLLFYDCRLARRTRFQMERGIQPKNAFFYMLEGEFRFRFDEEWETAASGELLCFPDHAPFEREILTPVSFYYIRFDNPQQLPLPQGKIRVSDRERLNSSIRYLLRLSELPEDAQELKQHFFTDICRQIEADRAIEKRKNSSVVNFAAEYLREHLQEEITLPELARKSGSSVSGLSAKFHEQLGVAPMQYLISLRIRKAQNLLCDTELSVAEIGAQCGFSNAYFFSNTFKKRTQISPGEYRKKHRI